MDMLHRVIDASPDALIVKNLSGEIVFWSRGAEKIYGYKKQQIVGKPISILGRPGKWLEVLSLIERVVAGEYIPHYQTTRVRSDGTEFRVSLSTFLVRDPDGTPAYVATMERDVTEHHRFQVAMAAARVDVGDQAVIEKDLSGNVVYWSRAAERLYGFQAYEIVGLPCMVLAPTGKRDELAEMINRTRSGETIRGIKLERVRKGGSAVLVEMSLSPIFDAKGGIVGIHSVSAQRVRG